jgi:cysteine desulfuration protein SufE
VELGEGLPPMDDAHRAEGNRVKGCISKVWVHAERDPGAPSQVRYSGDCDTAIIKGVLALLIDLMSGRTPADIASLDVDGLFERLQLAEHLSPNRHFGIYGIVELMKAQARALAPHETAAATGG